MQTRSLSSQERWPDCRLDGQLGGGLCVSGTRLASTVSRLASGGGGRAVWHMSSRLGCPLSVQLTLSLTRRRQPDVRQRYPRNIPTTRHSALCRTSTAPPLDCLIWVNTFAKTESTIKYQFQISKDLVVDN